MSVSKESFDAALLPGVRDRLAEAYRSLRHREQDVFQSVLDGTGLFREGPVRGIAHCVPRHLGCIAGLLCPRHAHRAMRAMRLGLQPGSN